MSADRFWPAALGVLSGVAAAGFLMETYAPSTAAALTFGQAWLLAAAGVLGGLVAQVLAKW